MSIKLKTVIEDGVGTEAKVVWIDAADDYISFQELVQRGANLWPNAPASIKELADMVTSGKVMQQYNAPTVHEKAARKIINIVRKDINHGTP